MRVSPALVAALDQDGCAAFDENGDKYRPYRPGEHSATGRRDTILRYADLTRANLLRTANLPQGQSPPT